MFTLDQIQEIHERLGKRSLITQYLKALHAIGVEKYDSFISDGHSEYFGKESQKVISPPSHAELSISKTCQLEGLLKHLSLHNEGKINYYEMSEGLAKSGIQKWSFDTGK